MTQLQFWDQSGVNPLPAGIYVTVTDPFGVVVGAGYTNAGGVLVIAATLNPSYTYTASFSGVLAPRGTVQFQGNVSPETGAALALDIVGGLDVGGALDGAVGQSVIAVPGYNSPTLSETGWTSWLIGKQPRGWYPDAAKVPGGVLYAVLNAIADMLGTLDYEIQQTLEEMRLGSSVGAQIDSWASDFIGTFWPRASGESDQTYITRIKEWLDPQPTGVPGAPLLPSFTTIAGIQFLANLYIQAYAPFTALSQGIALDIEGGLDVGGSLDGVNATLTLQPTVQVFDQQSNPALSFQIGLQPPQFCILLLFGNAGRSSPVWILNSSDLGDNTVLDARQIGVVTPPSAFDAFIRKIKALGTVPVYATYT